MNNPQIPNNSQPQKYEPRFANADVTPRREGGDDALAEINPTDARADEQVIVNTQSANHITNRSSEAEVDREGGETGNV